MDCLQQLKVEFKSNHRILSNGRVKRPHNVHQTVFQNFSLFVTSAQAIPLFQTENSSA